MNLCTEAGGGGEGEEGGTGWWGWGGRLAIWKIITRDRRLELLFEMLSFSNPSSPPTGPAGCFVAPPAAAPRPFDSFTIFFSSPSTCACDAFRRRFKSVVTPVVGPGILHVRLEELRPEVFRTVLEGDDAARTSAQKGPKFSESFRD